MKPGDGNRSSNGRYFYDLDRAASGPGIVDRCVVRRANLTVATKADRASCRERLHDRAKRAKRERERERGRGHTEGQRNCIKSHPLLAPLLQRRVTCIALTKENRPDLRPDRKPKKHQCTRCVPFETIFVVHRCFCWTKRKPMSSVRITRSTFL